MENCQQAESGFIYDLDLWGQIMMIAHTAADR